MESSFPMDSNVALEIEVNSFGTVFWWLLHAKETKITGSLHFELEKIMRAMLPEFACSLRELFFGPSKVIFLHHKLCCWLLL